MHSNVCLIARPNCALCFTVRYHIAANAVAAIASILATAKALMLLLLSLPKFYLAPNFAQKCLK